MRRARRRVGRWVAAIAAVTVTVGAVAGRLTLGEGVDLPARDATDGVGAESTTPSSAPDVTRTEPRQGRDTGMPALPRSPRAGSTVVPEVGRGWFDVAPGGSRIVGSGDRVTYTVEWNAAFQ